MSDRSTHTGDSFRRPVAVTDDGMARIGSTRAELMGIRFRTDPGTPPPSNNPAPPAANLPPADPTPPTPDPANPAPTPAATELPAVNPATGLPYTAAETQAHISRLNAEAKLAREAKETAEARATAAETRANDILKAAGFNPDGTAYTEIDPAKVTAEKAASDKAAEKLRRENIVLRIAQRPDVLANADKLLDSRAFSDELDQISGDDVPGSVETLLKTWVGKDPVYKVTPAAASTGSTAHTGTTPSTDRMTKKAALAKRFEARPTS